MDLFDFIRKLRPQQPLPAERARYFFFRTSLYCKHQRVYLSLPRLISTQSLSASRWLDPPWIIYGNNQLINLRAERKQNSFPGNVRQLSGKLSVLYTRLRNSRSNTTLCQGDRTTKELLDCFFLLLFSLTPFFGLALVTLLHLLSCPKCAFQCVCAGDESPCLLSHNMTCETIPDTVSRIT